MDHARKTGKSKSNHPWDIKISPPASTTDLHPKSPKYVEDGRLSNWNKWLEVREKTSKYLMSTINRKNEELVMNSCEVTRPKVEMQCLIEIASTPYNLEKAERIMEFWKMPEYLQNRRKPSSPEIGVALTKRQPIPRVNLPKIIQNEKSLNFSKNNQKQGNYHEYLERRKKQLAPNLSLLQPNEPDFDDLAVKGHGIKQKSGKKRTLLRVPVISISSPEESGVNLTSDKKYDAEDAMILKIFDHEIIFNESLFLQRRNKEPEPIMFSMSFTSMNSEKVEQTIVLENKGIYAIKYHWRRLPSKSNLLSPYIKVTRCFYFNKNPNIILPGQIMNLSVWFKMKSPGAYTEFWSLDTDPKISPRPIEFRFWGCDNAAVEKCNRNFPKTDTRSIDEYLDRRIRDTEIRVTLDILVDNVFENEEFLKRNPSLFYHPLVIRDMRKLYTEVAGKQLFWSLSLYELQQILLKINDPQLRNDKLKKFSNYHRKLLMPSFYGHLMREKYLLGYNLMSSFANGFDMETEYARSRSSDREFTRREERKIEGDVSRSRSASRASEVDESPRERKQKKKKGRSIRSGSSIVLREIFPQIQNPIETNHTEIDILGKTAKSFYDRIYKMLNDTIVQICSSVDGINESNTIAE